MYLIYSILYLIALFSLFPLEYSKRPRELRKRWIRERLGLYEASLQHPSTPSVWVHAVSVGEVIAAVPLIKKIKERHPATEVIVSTVTDTGQKVAKERIGDIARIVYVPFDLPFTINSAFRKIKPSLFIIMETELWPNAIRVLSRSGIPVLLMNGRISERSFSRYKKIGFFMKDVLKGIDLFCMQNELYAERIKELGAEPDKIKTIGNLKFDTRPSPTVPEWTGLLQRPVIIAGSTHRTEEDLIIDAYTRLRSDFPDLSLIIAPRHPERSREVEELLKKRGLRYLRRSEVTGDGSQIADVVVILDMIGELASVYSTCDIAIVGGSFIEHGGQNPLEPAYWGKAIVCGPHMENFPFIEDFYRSGGALETDADNLYESLNRLLTSPEMVSSMGRVAKELYEKNAGAIERAMEIIGRYL